jgi:7,8-dihydroneopterin aldolase/epimerase/oxygenase
MVMDTILIQGLQVDVLVGVHDWERRTKQPLLIDLDLCFDIRAAAASDDVAQALDYSAVIGETRTYLQGSGFKLLEALAEGLLTHLFSRFPMSSAQLRIRKPLLTLGVEAVGICIQRNRPTTNDNPHASFDV